MASVTDEFRASGAISLRRVFPREVVDAAARTFAASFGALTESELAERAAHEVTPILRVGDRRYEITVPMQEGFAAEELFANAGLCGVLQQLLDKDFQLNSFTVVVAHARAQMQHIHRDHAHLFGRESIDAALPPFAVSVAAPLIDLDPSLGPTGFWPGSHHWSNARVPELHEISAPLLQRGDALLLDYRTVHAGLPNLSMRARPILYAVYARPWFFDERNHRRRSPIDMGASLYDRLPEGAQKMLARAQTRKSRE